MSAPPPDDEHREPPAEGEADETETGEDELPPPATWAGRQHSGEDEAGEQGPEGEEHEPGEDYEDEDEAGEGDLGSGITDEFSLDDEEPGEEGELDSEELEVEVTDSVASEPESDELEAEEPDSDELAADEPDSEEVDAEPPEAEEPDSDELEADEPDSAEVDSDEAGTDEREPVTALAAPPVKIPTSAGPAASAADGEPEKPPRAGLWPRFIAAALIIVISMATATSATVLLYFKDIAEAIGENIKGLEGIIDQVDGGEPQTVLILGSDIRPEIEDKGRSDTTMLLRLDADRGVLSVLSLPRDLKVNIPGYGIGKLNEAYTIGGPKLTTKVVSQLTKLPINHVVNVDFSGFAEAVNAIECVFIDVDRDYFISNEGVFDESLKVSEIDIDAGYQQLCGLKALQYVRFRHDDNDIVRAARQQSFLREARAKVPPGELFKKRKEFIDIFTKYTTSDIDNAVAMLDVLKLFVELRDAPVRRIQFQGDIGGPNSPYVTASNDQIRTAVKQFLGDVPAPAEKAAKKSAGGKGKGKGKGKGGGGKEKAPPPAPELIDASEAAARYALDFDGQLRFPVIAPVRLTPGATYSEDSRAYEIDTYNGDHYPAYKMVFEQSGPYGVPEYYGAMGTRWRDPPILESPSETRQVGGRQLLLFYEGDRLQVVGFKTPRGSYWISNTLTGSLSEQQMIAVAESMKPFSPKN